MLKIRFFFSLQHKIVLRFFPNQKSKNQSKNRGTILADSQTSILSQFSTILHLDFKLAMMPIQPFNYQPPFCSPHALSSFASIYTLQLHKFPPISSTIGMPSAFLKTILASNYTSKNLSQIASSLAVASAIISDSIVDLDRMVCFLDFKEIAPLAMLNI